eukprot:SAG31_NODE_2635_length_5340_cov_15.869681_2_plen_89_part_00
MAAMEKDGHVLLPDLMHPDAVERCLRACAEVQAEHEVFTQRITPLRQAFESRVEAASTDEEREALEEERCACQWHPGSSATWPLTKSD